MRFQCSACGGIVAVDNTDLNIAVQCEHCGGIINSPASRTSPGAVIADFIIQKELGRGGMGVVYLSHQISLDRAAALKILSNNLANNSQFVVNFIKEARAAAKLNHPHIVQAYAVGEDDGIFYFAMEDVDGKTMKKILQEYKVIPCPQALLIVQQIAEALNYAWQEAKLIHRDIKPDNIMLTSSGRAKLSDLGLASVAGEIDDMDDEEIMGTPQYISPEHLTGAPMDARSDIYSLGATFYHFVTGQFPYIGKDSTLNPNEVAQQHITGTLIPPKEINPNIPQDVNDIIMKMMQRNPANRYQSTEELIDDIRKARHDVGGMTSAIHFPPPGTVEEPPMTQQQPAPKAPTETHTGGKKIVFKNGKGGKHLTLGGKTATATNINGANGTVREIPNKPKKTPKKGNGKGGKVILIIALLLLICGAGVATPFILKKLQKSNNTEKVTGTKVSEKELAIQKVIAAFKFKTAEEDSKIKLMCEQLFAQYPIEDSDSDKMKADYDELTAFYQQCDEKDVKQARASLIENYAADLERQQSEKMAAEKAEQIRISKEKEAKEKAEKDRVAREKAEKDALNAEQNAIKEAADNLVKWKKEVVTVILNSGDAEKPENAKEKITVALKEYQNKLADMKLSSYSKVQEMVPEESWPDILLQEIDGALAIHTALTKDFNTQLIGVEFTLKGNTKAKIKKVSDKKGDKRLFYDMTAVYYSKLTQDQKDELTNGIVKKIGKEDELWLYYLLTGKTSEAEQAGQNSEIYKMLKKAAE